MLTEALREAQSQNKDLSRQVQELMTIRVQLQNERDGLSAELSDTKDALKDALARLDAANAALTQLRTDMEHRLREKDEEIDNIRLVIVGQHHRRHRRHHHPHHHYCLIVAVDALYNSHMLAVS